MLIEGLNKKVKIDNVLSYLRLSETLNYLNPGVLSPLCLLISPRGQVVLFVVIVNILIHKSFKEVKKNFSI